MPKNFGQWLRAKFIHELFMDKLWLHEYPRATFAWFLTAGKKTAPDVDDDLLCVDGDARHPLRLLVADMLVDELRERKKRYSAFWLNKLEQLIQRFGG